jgi:hypothetical protein
MTPEQQRWIDSASYEQLLEKWRFAPAGDPMFQGDTGDYYSDVMSQKKSSCGHVRASKNIGW